MMVEKKKTTKKRVPKSKAASVKEDIGVRVESTAEERTEDKKIESAEETGGIFKKQDLQSDESHLGAPGRDRYFEAVGRRKTAVARVRLFTKPGDFTINDKLYSSYFSTPELLKIAEDALQKMKLFGRFKTSVRIRGGGLHAQAEALRLGLARCLVKFNPDFRKRLRRADFLKRDSRMKERKKPGLKRARKAPQWAKR